MSKILYDLAKEAEALYGKALKQKTLDAQKELLEKCEEYIAKLFEDKNYFVRDSVPIIDYINPEVTCGYAIEITQKMLDAGMHEYLFENCKWKLYLGRIIFYWKNYDTKHLRKGEWCRVDEFRKAYGDSVNTIKNYECEIAGMNDKTKRKFVAILNAIIEDYRGCEEYDKALEMQKYLMSTSFYPKGEEIYDILYLGELYIDSKDFDKSIEESKNVIRMCDDAVHTMAAFDSGDLKVCAYCTIIKAESKKGNKTAANDAFDIARGILKSLTPDTENKKRIYYNDVKYAYKVANSCLKNLGNEIICRNYLEKYECLKKLYDLGTSNEKDVLHDAVCSLVKYFYFYTKQYDKFPIDKTKKDKLISLYEECVSEFKKLEDISNDEDKYLRNAIPIEECFKLGDLFSINNFADDAKKCFDYGTELIKKYADNDEFYPEKNWVNDEPAFAEGYHLLGVELLTLNEFNTLPANVKKADEYWRLASDQPDYVLKCVGPNGDAFDASTFVETYNRPVITIRETIQFKNRYEEVDLFGMCWYVLDEHRLLSKSCVEKCYNFPIYSNEYGFYLPQKNNPMERVEYWFSERFRKLEKISPDNNGILRFPEYIERIGNVNNKSLVKKAYLPRMYERIENDCFADCVELEEIHIGECVGGSGHHLFDNCPRLEKIDFYTWDAFYSFNADNVFPFMNREHPENQMNRKLYINNIFADDIRLDSKMNRCWTNYLLGANFIRTAHFDEPQDAVVINGEILARKKDAQQLSNKSQLSIDDTDSAISEYLSNNHYVYICSDLDSLKSKLEEMDEKTDY